MTSEANSVLETIISWREIYLQQRMTNVDQDISLIKKFSFQFSFQKKAMQ